MLKQKRLYESQREQLYNQQFNIEQTTFAVQSMQDSVQTVQAMQAAGKELRQVMKTSDLKIDNIYKMQDDMEDLLVRAACLAACRCVCCLPCAGLARGRVLVPLLLPLPEARERARANAPSHAGFSPESRTCSRRSRTCWAPRMACRWTWMRRS